jgi:tetratricopeptide (TPR) repeat protein/DNA-binding XRE family transcriptional regulator
MADRPIECRALAVMREAAGLKKHELAGRLGMAPDTYYEYETGRVPPRPLLERAAAAVDHPPHHVDRTLDFLRRADTEAAAHCAGGSDAAADLEIDRLALSLGEFHGAVLRRSRWLARAVAEREMARVHFPRLRAHPAAERPALARENQAFQTWAVSELAAHESIEAAAGDPDEALAWAGLAVLIADLAPGEPAFYSRSQGYAAFHRGNAFRVKGRFRPEAEDEFERAKALWKAGEAGDPERLLDEARVLGMEASLRRELRQLPEALDLLDRALAADRGSERKYLLINRANVLEDAGDFEEALATLRKTLPLLDADHEPHLVWSARFNALVSICHLGRHAAAAEEYEDIRKVAARLGGGIRLARLGWLAGWIKAGLGQPAEAEAAFEQVRREFLQRDIPFDAALVSLELAVLYEEQGRTAEVRQLTRELAPVFESQRISREALATLLLFREAVEQETLTLELARRLRDDFRRSRGLEKAWS